MGIPSFTDSVKSRRYSTASTPTQYKPSEIANLSSQPRISQVHDVSLPLSILKVNPMVPNHNSLMPKAARSISVSDPLCTMELKSLSSQAGLPQSPHPLGANRYKTEMCRSFAENGYCKYATKCQFAHGEYELRNVMRHPKYKTELCRTFHNSGYCSYGSRCHFIHSEDERKLAEIFEQKKVTAAQQANQQMSLKIAELQMQKTSIETVLAQLVANQLSSQQPSGLQLVNYPRQQLLGSTGEFTPSSGSNSPVILSPALSFEMDSDQADSGIYMDADQTNADKFVFPSTSASSTESTPALQLSPTKQEQGWKCDHIMIATLMKALSINGACAGSPSARLPTYSYLNRE